MNQDDMNQNDMACCGYPRKLSDTFAIRNIHKPEPPNRLNQTLLAVASPETEVLCDVPAVQNGTGYSGYHA